MEKLFIDADSSIVGRLGSVVAKDLLKGREVVIINCEKAIISGNKKVIIEKIKRLRKMGHGGSMKGPKISKLPDRLLKRMIRGMLPWKKSKGRQAFKRLRCYTSKKELKEEELKKIKKLSHRKPERYLTVKQVSELI